ncbi:hypothetical protein ACHHYP_16064 [Achlya hypogyna]|uniref:F-box domain-containing protein n=1 Tax=Achlya hypogyna TaxID=1202772 RepID=A0A1V9Y9L9_ACHHY|nr:hypothetical protein ACHHYP_16064 [Achlya hypogyna]
MESIRPEIVRQVLTYIDAPEAVIGFLRVTPAHCLDAPLTALAELFSYMPLRDLWPELHLRTFLLARTMERVVAALPLFTRIHVYDSRHVARLAPAARSSLVLHPAVDATGELVPLASVPGDAVVGLHIDASVATLGCTATMPALSNYAQLRDLRLLVTNAQAQSVVALLPALATAHALVNLSLIKHETSEVLSLDDVAVDGLAQWLLTRLSVALELRSIDAASPVAADRLTSVLLASASLVSLAFAGAVVCAGALLRQPELLPPALASLELSNCRLTAPSWDVLQNASLRHLDLSGTYLGPPGLAQLAAILPTLPHLQALHLTATLPDQSRMDAAYLPADTEGGEIFALALRRLPRLEVLSLGRNRLQDDDLLRLLPALSSRLVALDLSGNHLRNAAAAALSAAATHFPRLAKLHLKNNAFGNEGARVFAKRLSQWRALTELSFLGRDMDMYGIIMLLRALPTGARPLVRLDVSGPCCRRPNDTAKITETARSLGLVDASPKFSTRLPGRWPRRRGSSGSQRASSDVQP